VSGVLSKIAANIRHDFFYRPSELCCTPKTPYLEGRWGATTTYRHKMHLQTARLTAKKSKRPTQDKPMRKIMIVSTRKHMLESHAITTRPTSLCNFLKKTAKTIIILIWYRVLKIHTPRPGDPAGHYRLNPIFTNKFLHHVYIKENYHSHYRRPRHPHTNRDRTT